VNWSETFPAARASARQARGFATRVLEGLNETQRSAIALMVSELATNCVVHAESSFTVSIQLSETAVMIEVSDQGHGRPVMRSPDHSEANGRGLQIVDALADSWHIEHHETGSVVHIEVRLDSNARNAKPARESDHEAPTADHPGARGTDHSRDLPPTESRLAA
jgi:anti-sigma regulatory factor (Ser/Thr protein kinase)